MVMIVLSFAVFFQLFTLPTHYTTKKQQQLETTIAENKKAAAKKLEEAQKKAKQEKATDSSAPKSSTTAISTAATTTSSSSPAPAPVTLSPQDQAIATKYGISAEQLTRAKTMQLSAVGDSVILDALNQLTEVFPNVLMDGEVGRQLYTSPAVFQKLSDSGVLQDNVLISLGSNGPFTEAQFDNVMKVIGTTRHVFWINVREPKQEWQDEVNAMLTQMAAKYKNITLIDWYSVSKDHNDWFYDDQVHPTPDGSLFYAKLIIQSILK